MRIDNSLIAKSLNPGLESYSPGRASSTAGTEAMTPMGMATSGWSLETEQQLITLLKGNTPNLSDGGMLDGTGRAKAFANIKSMAIQQTVKSFATESTSFQALPKEVKDVLAVPALALSHAKTELSGATSEDGKFIARYKIKQATHALESGLWSILSGIEGIGRHTMNSFGARRPGNESYSIMGKSLTMGPGLESANSSYADQVFVPKVSAFNSWVNIAGCIMPKVQKTKTVLNEICEIPVSTKHMIAIERDDTGKEVRRWKREDLYANMDMSATAPGLDMMRTRDLVLNTAEFGKANNLYLDNLSGHNNAPFLATGEYIGPQMNVTKITTGTTANLLGDTPFLADTRAGLSKGPTIGQSDMKGKVIPFTPDANTPAEFYNIVLDYDQQGDQITFLFTKSVAGMDDITQITLSCNMRDVEQTLRSKIAFRIQEEKTVLHTPEIDRYVIPILTNEFEHLADRGSSNHLNKLVELTAEHTQNKKESSWIKSYKAMKTLLATAHANMISNNASIGGEANLYVNQSINLNTLSETRKPESVAYHLGNNLNVVKEKYASLANSNYDVQLSMFAGALALPVLAQCFETITGEISEDSDNKFLGVSQSDKVKAITFGKTTSAPVQAIIVGTGKRDFQPVGYAGGTEIDAPDIEYKYEIIPTFKDENIQTTLFVEQPTKVISGSEVRAIENLQIPSMIIHEGYKFNTLRPAGGDLTIQGVGFKATT